MSLWHATNTLTGTGDENGPPPLAPACAPQRGRGWGY